MSSEISLVADVRSSSSTFQKIMKSKWTDVALLTGFAALFIIAILASTGVFNFMGTTNAAYLSHGMYGGAALFIIAEIIKVAVNCIDQKPNVDSTRTNVDGRTKNISIPIICDLDQDLNAQISQVEISSRCFESYPCQHNCTITFANGDSAKTILNGYEARALTLAIDHKKFVCDKPITGFNPVDHFMNYDLSKMANITAQQVIKNIMGN
jgi:hypothetical protein